MLVLGDGGARDGLCIAAGAGRERRGEHMHARSVIRGNQRCLTWIAAERLGETGARVGELAEKVETACCICSS